MRRILTEYFVHNYGYNQNDLQKIILKENESCFIRDVNGKKDVSSYQLAKSLISYISNDSTSTINYSLYMDDLAKLKGVFQLIFSALGQNQHYDMIIKRFEYSADDEDNPQ